MQPCGCTPWDENVCGAEAGNHKGCPYNGPAGAYFHSNRSCRLSPTPPIMKMAVRAIRESPLREVGRGYFQRNLSCSLAACTTSNEKCMRSGSGQPQGLPLQWACRGLFSYQSFMSVVTDTTNHENGGKGDSRIAPTGGWPGVFSEESLMQPCGLHNQQ